MPHRSLNVSKFLINIIFFREFLNWWSISKCQRPMIFSYWVIAWLLFIFEFWACKWAYTHLCSSDKIIPVLTHRNVRIFSSHMLLLGFQFTTPANQIYISLFLLLLTHPYRWFQKKTWQYPNPPRSSKSLSTAFLLLLLFLEFPELANLFPCHHNIWQSLEGSTDGCLHSCADMDGWMNG